MPKNNWGGIIGIVIVILVLLIGAYYFWQSKVEPRLEKTENSSQPATSSENVEINLTATSS